MKKPRIIVLLGSAREGRQSEKVARFVFNEIKARGDVEAEFIDVKDFLFARTSEDQPISNAWKEIVNKAHGFVIVSPEYNHSFPGELKILLDSLSEGYDKKPVAICGVSIGKFGGARMIDHIKQVLVHLGMIPITLSVNFPQVGEAFDDKGDVIDQSLKMKVATITDELVWFMSAVSLKQEQK